MNKRKLIKILVAALLLEILVFNFRHWESLTFREASFTLQKQEDHIELTDINAHIDNLYLDLFPEGDDRKKGSTIRLQIDFTDEGHALYTWMPDTEIVFGLPESLYKRVYLSGASEKIRIRFPDQEAGLQNISAEKIRLNAVKPFFFCIPRVLVLFCVLTFLYVFRPGSEIYKIPLSSKDRRQKALIRVYILCIMAVIVMAGLTCFNFHWEDTAWQAELQYNYLAEALLKGHVSLEVEAPSCFLEVPNPYDYALRETYLISSGQSQTMDLAYFQGKYYSYFGIVPVLLFYIPFLLLTGKQLGTGYIILFLGGLFVPAVFWYVYTCARKYFRRVSLGMYLMLSTSLVFGAGLLYLVQNSTIYSLPILMGLLLDLLGITFWMNAADGKGGLSKKMLLAGAVCIALVMGCRPHLAIALLLAFPIFWNEIRGKKFFSLSGAGNTLIVMGPFFIVGFLLMGYNYARFGNVFEFGATLNMTGFDMMHRGFVPERFKLGFFEYFFQPPVIRPQFPYVYSLASMMHLQTDYLGQTVNEPFIAGFFPMNLIGVAVFFLGKVKKKLQEKKIYILTLLCLAFAVILVAVDTQIVGITARYLSDFSMFMMIAAAFIILAVTEEGSELHDAFIVLMIISIFFNLVTLSAYGANADLRAMRALLYYWLKYLFALGF